MTARGIRNNNPGNLRHGEDWLGLAPVQDDQNFCTFTEMHFGVRALLKTLRTYVENGKSRLGWGITPQPGVKPASSRA